MTTEEAKERSGAKFSECRNYRYALWRIWDDSKPLVMFIGLNPSTANESGDDPTIRRVRAISKNLGYGGVYMMNCFPFVSTDPDALRDYDKTISQQHHFMVNNRELKEVAEKCRDIVFAWGNFKVVKDLGRDIELIRVFQDAKALHINKNGSPKHPLYCKTDIQPVQFNQSNPQS
jgi:hypothetical protein